MELNEENIKKGKEAELKFKKWMDKNKIPYWYINQDIESFSKALKNYNVKRPDFFLLLPNFGSILIDVKNTKPADKHEKFFINPLEVEKYINLQKLINIQCWYVISNEDNHFQTWYWIPMNKIIEIIKDPKKNNAFKFKLKADPKKESYSVPISEFIQVSSNDSLSRIFEKIFEFI